MTKPGYFEYSIGTSQSAPNAPADYAVAVNLLFVAAIGMIYAPLAPLVAIGACIVFWFSSVVVRGLVNSTQGDVDAGSTSISCFTFTSPEPKAVDGCGMSTSTA